MIIKEISIRNFRSYYGENKFEFSEGLTLVIGDNGDGKTTFFEALQWLFNTATENNSIDNASEMRKSKLEIGESDEVAVRMVFDHDGEKVLKNASLSSARRRPHSRLLLLRSVDMRIQAQGVRW